MREEYHFSEWRTLLVAQREIAVAAKDMATMHDLDVALKALNKQFG
ncbi:MAG: hypothetical protein JWM42_3586 [Burkholderia sp.]|nr:hypothetical protein [Burkholderia sp.]